LKLIGGNSICPEVEELQEIRAIPMSKNSIMLLRKPDFRVAKYE